VNREQTLKLFGVFIFIAGIFTISIFLSQHIAESKTAKELVHTYGYAGIFVLALIGGFNLLIPIPAGVFAPIFLESGLPVAGIILALAIGTSIADLIAYAIGWFGRHSFNPSSYPLFQKIEALTQHRQHFIVPIIFLYASFAPYPNEVLVIPLAFLGIRMRTIIVPLFVGNAVYNSLLVLGVQGILQFFRI